eukprot:CAMPEP_0197434336 /NCGR_PEP_ID=MMETSP1175-20131217/2091_1 /TAXON_ID=1003142 /ORGANISM="Triceratium dubium, Strain CCMP147" /LENGTH=104 /DNA_ID=CAMNT_0042963019 /DNA_START=60 /DNA_END=370 /DNA_ORIENTATION=-
MRHVAAYLMLVLGGNATPSADDVKGVLSSVGVEADDAQLKSLISSLEGKDLNELIEEGKKKLVNVGGGGRGGGAAGGAAGGAEAAAVEEKEEESEEESAGGAGG